jgi:ribosome-binding protein aMBF1 (putative translation factor)
MPIDTSSFGRAIASARKELRLSQKELAGKIVEAVEVCEIGRVVTRHWLS